MLRHNPFLKKNRKEVYTGTTQSGRKGTAGPATAYQFPPRAWMPGASGGVKKSPNQNHSAGGGVPAAARDFFRLETGRFRKGPVGSRPRRAKHSCGPPHQLCRPAGYRQTRTPVNGLPALKKAAAPWAAAFIKLRSCLEHDKSMRLAFFDVLTAKTRSRLLTAEQDPAI